MVSLVKNPGMVYGRIWFLSNFHDICHLKSLWVLSVVDGKYVVYTAGGSRAICYTERDGILMLEDFADSLVGLMEELRIPVHLAIEKGSYVVNRCTDRFPGERDLLEVKRILTDEMWVLGNRMHLRSGTPEELLEGLVCGVRVCA